MFLPKTLCRNVTVNKGNHSEIIDNVVNDYTITVEWLRRFALEFKSYFLVMNNKITYTYQQH